MKKHKILSLVKWNNLDPWRRVVDQGFRYVVTGTGKNLELRKVNVVAEAEEHFEAEDILKV